MNCAQIEQIRSNRLVSTRSHLHCPREHLARLVDVGSRAVAAPDERMQDRGFNELDLRLMLQEARSFHGDIEPGRWVIETRLDRRRWEVIVEPDSAENTLVVVTAYPFD
jgi:hypothetical protein